MTRLSLAFFSILALGGCAAMPAYNQAAIDARADTIEARIVKACESSGWFKAAGGIVLAAVPLGTLPQGVFDAGVDRVCANPERYAKYWGTAEWVAKNLWDLRRQ